MMLLTLLMLSWSSTRVTPQKLTKPHLRSSHEAALGKEETAIFVQFVTAFASRVGTRDISLCIKLQEESQPTWSTIAAELLNNELAVHPCFDETDSNRTLSWLLEAPPVRLDAKKLKRSPEDGVKVVTLQPGRHGSRLTKRKTPIYSVATEKLDCLQSMPNKPGNRGDHCKMVPWPFQVFITDGPGVADCQRDAEVQYHLNYGAVRQLIIGTEVNALPVMDRPIETKRSPTVVTLASFNAAGRRMELTNIYRFRESTRLLLNSVGSWTEETGLELGKEFWGGPSDFQGHVLVLVTLLFEPDYIELKNRSKKIIPSYEHRVGGSPQHGGHLLDIIELVAAKLNFTYRISEPLESTFGNGYSDNCQGVVGKLCKRQADLALNTLTLKNSRLEAMDGLFPIWYNYESLFYRKNVNRNISRWAVFVNSFHWSVWVVVLFVSLLSTGMSSLLMMAGNHTPTEDPSTVGFPNGIFLHFASLMQQGHPIIPGATSLRIVHLVFWTFSLILFACYCARLTSFLAVNLESKPFRSLEDAVRAKHWQLVAMENTGTHMDLQTLKNDWAQGFVKRMKEHPELFTAHSRYEALERVQSSNTVFYTGRVMTEYILPRNGSVDVLQAYQAPYGQGFGMEKNSPFYGAINSVLADLCATGVLKKLRKTWFKQQIKTVDNIQAVDPFGFDNMRVAFMLLAAGVALACVILCCEILEARKRRYDLKEMSLSL